MSRSVKKNSFGSWHSSKSMKAWRTQENRRLRHNSKQIINICDDYDVLIIPDIDDYDTLWGSPQDGKKHYWEAPLANQCEVDLYEHQLRTGRDEWYTRYYGFNKGHFRNCRCYSNKHNWYWKNLRK